MAEGMGFDTETGQFCQSYGYNPSISMASISSPRLNKTNTGSLGRIIGRQPAFAQIRLLQGFRGTIGEYSRTSQERNRVMPVGPAACFLGCRNWNLESYFGSCSTASFGRSRNRYRDHAAGGTDIAVCCNVRNSISESAGRWWFVVGCSRSRHGTCDPNPATTCLIT